MGSRSPQIEEEVLATSAVLRSWGYEAVVVAPLTRGFRRRLAAAGVVGQEAPEPSGGSLRAQWSEAHALAALIAEARPLLIHAHGFRTAVAGLLARRKLADTTPLVVSPHLLPHLLREDPRLGLRRTAYRYVLSHCDAVVVQTETQRQELASLQAEAAEHAELVPYGLSPQAEPDALNLGRRRELLGMTPSGVLVGCVVDALEVRALQAFLDAAARLCMEYPSLEFALIGRGVDRECYHDLAHRRGLMGATVFVDPRDRFFRAVSTLNVLVTPQQGWPSGMLALQALSANIGVVAIEGGEVDEILGEMRQVTLATADGAAALGAGIMHQLKAATERMPRQHDAVQTSEASPFLVSKQFYDLGESWAVPGGRRSDAEAQAPGPEVAAAFGPTRAARALIGVYQRLLDEA